MPNRPDIYKADKVLADYMQQLRDAVEDHAEGSDAMVNGINYEIAEFLLQFTTACGDISPNLSDAGKAGLLGLISSDRKIMFYSWDRGPGGEYTRYQTVVVCRQGRKLVSSVFEPQLAADPGRGYSYSPELAKKRKDGTTVYVLTGFAIDPEGPAGLVLAITIADGELRPVPFFKREGIASAAMRFRCNIASVPDDTNARDLPEIHFGRGKKRLYFPLLTGPDEHGFSTAYSIYDFDGEHFTYSAAGPKDEHKDEDLYGPYIPVV